MAKHGLIMSIILLFASVCAFAQNAGDDNKYIPNVLSPNSAEIGKYGRTPVNYFTGTPSIKLPLTSLEGKGINIPVYLSYHAGGNKPDQHPGWVGQGWSLRAGGQINRVVKGISEDELTSTDAPLNQTNGFGYLSHMERTQQGTWTEQDLMNFMIGQSVGDYGPDEFQINLEDLSASFYFYSADSVAIVSKTGEDFKVEIELNTTSYEIIVFSDRMNKSPVTAPAFSYIKQIDIIRNDGSRYVFGGDESAIEFALYQKSHYSVGSNHEVNSNIWDSYTYANSWMLSRIEKPGGEQIIFTYEHDGLPLIRSVCHSGYIYASNAGNIVYDSRNAGVYHTYADDPYLGVNYVFTLPSYLTGITSLITKDTLSFSRSRSTELKYPVTENEILWVLGDYRYLPGYNHNIGGGVTMMDYLDQRNYFMQLDSIVGKRVIIDLNYTSSTEERLKLLSVNISPSAGDAGNFSYSMSYNPLSLPAYNAKKSDSWGYFNDKFYGNIPYASLASYRTSDVQKMQAEILTSITWPTGGRTSFDYEAHTYSKRVDRFPFHLVDTSGVAGGLRIKRISDISGVDTLLSRTYLYEDSLGLSSGILSGEPLFDVYGEQHTSWSGHWSRWVYIASGHIDSEYHLWSENPINEMSLTDGSHITYSTVTEINSDGSKDVYHFTNHDTPIFADRSPILYVDDIDGQTLYDSFSSMELARGLLSQKDNYDSSGRLLKRVSNTYAVDTLSFIRSISQVSYCQMNVARVTLSRIFTFYPALVTSTTSEYDDDGNLSITELAVFNYNGRLLSSKNITFADGTYKEDKYRYAGDISGDIYPSMVDAGMTGIPIERLHLRNGSIIGGELTKWIRKTLNNSFIPWKEYKLELNQPLLPFVFTKYNGINMDSHYSSFEISYDITDSFNNVCQYTDRSNETISYIWGYGGAYPIAKVEGVSLSDLQNSYGISGIYDSYLPVYLETTLRSAGAKVTTWRWKPCVGLSQETDISGRTKLFDYDSFGRLIGIYDEDGHVITSYTYHYRTNSF